MRGGLERRLPGIGRRCLVLAWAALGSRGRVTQDESGCAAAFRRLDVCILGDSGGGGDRGRRVEASGHAGPRLGEGFERFDLGLGRFRLPPFMQLQNGESALVREVEQRSIPGDECLQGAVRVHVHVQSLRLSLVRFGEHVSPFAVSCETSLAPDAENARGKGARTTFVLTNDGRGG